jgi:hypothetical protein
MSLDLVRNNYSSTYKHGIKERKRGGEREKEREGKKGKGNKYNFYNILKNIQSVFEIYSI